MHRDYLYPAEYRICINRTMLSYNADDARRCPRERQFRLVGNSDRSFARNARNWRRANDHHLRSRAAPVSFWSTCEQMTHPSHSDDHRSRTNAMMSYDVYKSVSCFFIEFFKIFLQKYRKDLNPSDSLGYFHDLEPFVGQLTGGFESTGPSMLGIESKRLVCTPQR